MSKKPNAIDERLKNLGQQKDEISTSGSTQKKVIGGLMQQEAETPDFAKIASELAEHHEKEKRSLNDGYVKDTIYIQEDLYKAFNALCTERGLKKTYVNEAIKDFVLKKHKELMHKK